MSFPPILAALRKHKAGVFLIGLQIALTLAIVCNLIFIVAVRVQRVQRPTGMNEHDLFIITQQYIDASTSSSTAALQKLDSMQATDLAALRRLPDVVSATTMNALPISDSYSMAQIALKPDQPHGLERVNEFTGDAHTVQTLGLHLIAGRNFTRNEVQHWGSQTASEPAVVVVTQTLADKLFPRGDALGRPIYLGGSSKPSTIIGVVARLQGPNTEATGSAAWDSVLVPVRIDSASTMYAVRTKPGRMQAAMREARKALYAVDPLRVIPPVKRFDPEGIASFAQWRKVTYALDIYFAQILTVICLILLAITGIGMTGLTSFWVRQRHKQIGIRRALGARKIDILHYFQMENLLIAGGGCVAGVVLAIGINLALLRMFQMDRMPVWYVAVGVIVILLLGQLAVFAPARRASNVPPVVATRSV
ncbi:MAG TPA: FtsX-like permease family protein [Rhodanobacteraceae bacterium]|nr:FtsX-like permease family protein [Rhodanobacteraceae bacterium]